MDATGHADSNRIGQRGIVQRRQIVMRPGGADQHIEGRPLLRGFESTLARQPECDAEFGEPLKRREIMRLPPGFAEKNCVRTPGAELQDIADPPRKRGTIMDVAGLDRLLDAV